MRARAHTHTLCFVDHTTLFFMEILKNPPYLTVQKCISMTETTDYELPVLVGRIMVVLM